MQSVSCIRAFDRIHDFRGDSAFGTWLHAVGNSVALNTLRKVKRFRSREADLDEARAVADATLEAEPDLRARLRAALDDLPHKYRMVFIMHDVEGFKHHEIAESLGGGWRAASRVTDLGTVPASEAADYLTGLVRGGRDHASRDVVMPASIADSAVVWPALIDVARDANRPRRTRRVALQWVGMAAGDVVTDGQTVVDDADRETREQAVFAVSQLPKDEGVPLLIEVARSHRDPQVRRRALFWLGQSGDARAIDLFEELLRGR